MNIINNEWKKSVFVFSVVMFLLMGSLVVAQGEEGRRRFKINGTIESVSVAPRSYVLKSKKRVYVTDDTVIKNKGGQNVSFSQLIQPGNFVGAIVEEVHERFIAISIKESNEG